jgi:hypothetical protein
MTSNAATEFFMFVPFNGQFTKDARYGVETCLAQEEAGIRHQMKRCVTGKVSKRSYARIVRILRGRRLKRLPGSTARGFKGKADGHGRHHPR